MKRKKYMRSAEVVKGSRLIWIAGKFLVMMVLFFLAVYFCIEGQQAAKTVTVILNGKALEYDQAALICEQEKKQTAPLETCFWGEVYQQDVSCPETGKSCSLTEIVTIGNTQLIRPEIGALVWQKEGCYVDSCTAEELFGTGQVKGQMIRCGDRSFTVYGVFKSYRKLMIRQCVQEDGSILQTAVLRQGQKRVSGEEEQFLLHLLCFAEKTVNPDRLCSVLFLEIHGILRFLTKNLHPILADLVEKK